MANDLNRHECIGRLGQDPEIKYTADGKAIANISVACSESWKDKNTGNNHEKTEWIRYVAFGRLAEITQQYLKKGSRVYLSGKLRSRKWQDQQGQDRYTTEIVCSEMQMLDNKADGASNPNAAGGQRAPMPPPQNPPVMQDASFDDDIPY